MAVTRSGRSKAATCVPTCVRARTEATGESSPGVARICGVVIISYYLHAYSDDIRRGREPVQSGLFPPGEGGALPCARWRASASSGRRRVPKQRAPLEVRPLPSPPRLASICKSLLPTESSASGGQPRRHPAWERTGSWRRRQLASGCWIRGGRLRYPTRPGRCWRCAHDAPVRDPPHSWEQLEGLATRLLEAQSIGEALPRGGWDV